MNELQRRVVEAFVAYVDENQLKELVLKIRYYPYFTKAPDAKLISSLTIGFSNHYKLSVLRGEIESTKGLLYGRVDNIERFLKEKLGKDFEVTNSLETKEFDEI